MPISIDFKGKLVLITGGGRGIGLAITRACAEAGADLAITYTSQDCSALAADLSREFSTTVRAFKCDVGQSAQVDAMVDEVQKSFGREVDRAVCNAGISLWVPSHAMTDAEMQNIFAVNAFGPYYVSRALVRSWLGEPTSVPAPTQPAGALGTTPGSTTFLDPPHGKKLDKHIVFVSSISGLVAMNPQNQSAYNASKGALTMFGKSLAGEWAKLGVRVNMISPGYVATDMIASDSSSAPPPWVAEWTARTPVGEFASAAQVGDAVALMLSERMGGGFMTGTDLVLDGGYTVF